MSIFERNIAQIRRYNPVLADKINSHIFDNSVKFELITAESGDTNLIYNETVIHSNEDPQQEAIEIFNQLKSASGSSVTIIIGLGIGYLFKRLYLSSKGKIIVFEPNLDILRFTLEVVDFSSELSDDRIYIAGTQLELMKFLDKTYIYKAYLNVCGLSSSHKLYPVEVRNLTENLPQIVSHLEANFSTIFERSFKWATQGMLNIPALVNSHNIDSLRNKFRSIPAVIVSSGPSLDDAIEHLAQNKDKAIIFCTANSYKALAKYKIKPDFITFIEVEDVTTQIKGFDISDINLITQPISNISTFKLNSKNKFVFYDNNDLFSRWISNITGFSTENYINKGTVSYCALYSAFMMGCNPIILLGQDLAYRNNKCYSSDSAYGALKFIQDEITGQYKIEIDNLEEFTKYFVNENYLNSDISAEKLIQIKLNELNSSIKQVPGQNGEMLLTDSNYAAFIKFFEQFAYDHPEPELINSSIGGAQIQGFQNIELIKVMEKLQPLEINVNNVINDILFVYKEPIKENSEEIKTNVECMLKDIDRFILLANNGLEKTDQLLKELAKTPFDVEKIRFLICHLVDYYLKFQDELFDKYLILTNCVFEELLNLNKAMGESENSIGEGLEDLINIAGVSEAFYKTFLSNAVLLKNLAEGMLKELSVYCNSME